jgi:hypothetical protein
MEYVKKLDINGVEIRLTSCIELHGRPNAATEGAVGVLGVDLDSSSHQMYVCIAVNGAIHTWIPVTSGGSGGTGVDGITPHIGTNGNWYLGDEDTGVCATGTHVVSVEEVNRDATLSTYRMNFSDGEGYEFTVYHGQDGKSAYEYAQDGGYTGTEEEFAEDVNPDNIVATAESFIIDELAKHGQLKPEFANDISECTDNSKLYVLPDGYIYAFIGKYIEGGTHANFTNQLPISTDVDTDNNVSNDEIYNKNDTKGYKSGIRLNTSGVDSVGTGHYTSGFIPIKMGDVVRFKNIGFSNSSVNGITASNQRVCLYDSNKNFIGVTNAAGVLGTGELSGVTGDDGNISQFTVANFATYDLSNVGFFRISGHYIGDDTIITVNEEITYTTTEGGIVYEWGNTGHAFVPADYEDRILELETDLERAKQKIESIENTKPTSGDDVPQAVVDGASALVNKALSRKDTRILRFLISSDAHQKNDYEPITKGNKELGQAYGEILSQIGVDFVSNLGDSAWASHTDTAETVKEQIKQFNRFVIPHIKGEQILNCEGNHDDAVYSTIDNDGDGITSSAEKLSLEETFSLIYARNKNVVYDADHYIDGYCYKDFEHLKVRVICLNTEQGTYEGGFIENYQLTWFEEVALDLTDKTDWSVITLAHHPLSYGLTSLNAATDIVDAFINRGGNYIGHFHGHAHAFSVARMQKHVNGVYTDINAWEICIPNACFTRSNQYLGSTNERILRYSTPTTYNKSDVDGQRTSFNLVTVCLDTKKIYADNYGAGIDRQITY